MQGFTPHTEEQPGDSKRNKKHWNQFSAAHFLQEDTNQFPCHLLIDTTCHLLFNSGELKAFQVWKLMKPWARLCNTVFDKNHFNEQISLRYATYLKSENVLHKLITHSFCCTKCSQHSWSASVCFYLGLFKIKSLRCLFLK